MLQIELGRDKERRFAELAESRGETASNFAQALLEHYLDFQTWPTDSAEEWAAASERLAREVMIDEDWASEAADESR
jgi:predicted transcriptional regulator